MGIPETIVVEFIKLEVGVDLPEGIQEIDSKLTEKCRERAIYAAVSAIPQQLEVYIDGEIKEPAKIWIELHEDDVQEVRVEG